MNVMENLMLQQMYQMASNMANTLPQTGGTSEGKDPSSFQDMMEQAGKDNVETGKDDGVKDQPSQEKPGSTSKKEDAPVDKEAAAAPQQVHGDPNAMQAMIDVFRPEIVEASSPEIVVEAPVEPAAVETVVETPVVEPEMPVEAAAVELPVEEEAVPVPVQQGEEPIQQTVESFQETVQKTEVPVEETARAAEQPEAPKEAVQTQEAQPQRESETVEVQVREAPQAKESGQEQDAGGETQDEAAQLNQAPLFQDAEAAPVKVGETYKTLDTQEPDMDENLANTIRQAVEDGAQKIEIRLNPANLGQVTIEMTRDSGGALQVAIHVATGKAETLLTQHLDGLHAALQGYSQGQEVRLEVQRNQEAPQQQNQQQTNPDGHNQQQHHRHPQQEQRRDDHAGDFLQRLRLGLVTAEETL